MRRKHGVHGLLIVVPRVDSRGERTKSPREPVDVTIEGTVAPVVEGSASGQYPHLQHGSTGAVQVVPVILIVERHGV